MTISIKKLKKAYAKMPKTAIPTKPIFNQKEFAILFDALDVYSTEIYDARYNGNVNDYGTKRQVEAKLKAIKKLEDKLNKF